MGVFGNLEKFYCMAKGTKYESQYNTRVQHGRQLHTERLWPEYPKTAYALTAHLSLILVRLMPADMVLYSGDDLRTVAIVFLASQYSPLVSSVRELER